MADVRTEIDSFGSINVPAERLWGAQTQRSLQFFNISTEHMPREMIRALVLVKRSAARVNGTLNLLPKPLALAIEQAADEVLAGQYPDEFPLMVWQTGSGTQTNMNVNEVLANRASELLGGTRGQLRKVHANDDVNRGQSSNDVFPSAMHIASVIAIRENLLPAIARLTISLREKAQHFAGIIKVGRTHLQDAIPLTLGQEFSGYVAQLEFASSAIELALPGLHGLAIGATAVGTGLNAPAKFGPMVAADLASSSGYPFICAGNKFAALAGHEPIVFAHGALKTLASALNKVANDIRWLASGPRSGLGELSLPENEPGSSIMPGKVNPTQSEALTMICAQVTGNDVAIGIGAASGNFELNVFKPLLIHNFLQSCRLLADGCNSFDMHCVRGIRANEARIADLLQRSLMLVTALTPHIGYDRAAQLAKKAHAENLTLREAALALGYANSAELDLWLNPQMMIRTC